MRVLLVTLLLGVVTLAGCAENQPPTTVVETEDGEEKELQVGKGGILGLVIDDRFRPIPGALVLIQPAGVTVTANNNGEFEVNDLDPGAYSLRVSAEGHEAAPDTVTVKEGEFAEKSLLARRVVSQGGTIITREFSVFIPCAIDYVADGRVLDCTLDQSGDSFRAGFDANYTEEENVTYMITEMRANKEGRYEVQVREEGNGERYAVAQFEGEYLKLTHKMGEVNTDWDGQANNVAWTNNRTIEVILFADSEYREELQDAGAPTCCGVGVHFGIKAQFVQSVFIGEPEMDINSYGVLA